MPRPPRPRRQLREQQRALRKSVRLIERLATELPGGSAERPIDVGSASVVETRARAIPCLQCDGVDLELRADRATATARGVLRELTMICRRCRAPRAIWFRLAAGAN